VCRHVVLALVLAVAAPSASAAPARLLPGFRSPSRNIRCLYLPPGRGDTGRPSPSALLCSIRRAHYGAELQDRCLNPGGKRGEGVDWHGWELSPTRRARILCSGGILYRPERDHPHYVTLPYGRSWRRGAFTCFSRTAGITCRTPRGHGLFVARESWRAW
jgi:hypothetical protein